MSNNLDIPALKALHAAATPGRWEVRYSPDESGYPCYFLLGLSGYAQYDARQHEVNAAAIAALHNQFPALVAEIERLREQNAKLHQKGAAQHDAFMIFLDGIVEELADVAANHNGVIQGHELDKHLQAASIALRQSPQWLAARDARMKREGAIEELERAVAEDCTRVFPEDLPHVCQEFLEERIKELRKGGE